MGTISIGGIDLKDLKTDDLRGHIAVVPQNASLFSSTVYDNIAFGKPDASPAAVEQAAQEANAHSFITDLPQGYNTLIGEKGRAIIRWPAATTSHCQSIAERCADFIA
jgi:ABC-type multidrug transport system fused ATPase/permease subunit